MNDSNRINRLKNSLLILSIGIVCALIILETTPFVALLFPYRAFTDLYSVFLVSQGLINSQMVLFSGGGPWELASRATLFRDIWWALPIVAVSSLLYVWKPRSEGGGSRRDTIAGIVLVLGLTASILFYGFEFLMF